MIHREVVQCGPFKEARIVLARPIISSKTGALRTGVPDLVRLDFYGLCACTATDRCCREEPQGANVPARLADDEPQKTA